MADWDVDENTKLGRFLHLKKVQMWRIPILAKFGGVKLIRKGKEVRINDEKTAVFVGDKVRPITPTPPKCAKALQQEADTNWRDYAIVPGTSDFDKRIAKVLDAQPTTIVLKSAAIASIEAFVQGIRDSDQIKFPIRHLIIGGHANFEGHLKIPLHPLSQQDDVTYEDLEDAVKTKSLVVDTTLLEPRPREKGIAIPSQFIVFGCSVGAQKPYMSKFKQALGGQLPVIAPNHFLVGGELASPRAQLLYMAYHFAAIVPTMLKDKKAVVAALHARGYVRENGTPVPQSAWDKWLPPNPNYKPNALLPLEMKNQVVLPVLRVKENAPRRFVLHVRELFKGGSTIGLTRDTGKEADRKKAVKADLSKLARYQASHPFPEYVRFGYKTMDEFMDGWDWNFSYDKTAKALSFDPKRHEYRLLHPIVTVAKAELVMNCYPTGTVPKKFQGQLPLEQLKFTDAFYFSTY